MFNHYIRSLLLYLLCFLVACQPNNQQAEQEAQRRQDSIAKAHLQEAIQDIGESLIRQQQHQVDSLHQAILKGILNQPDSTWVELRLLIPDVVLDIRYATTNNFMKTQIYDCGKCFTRLAVAKALQKVQDDLKTKGLGLKMFDCYRPSSAQYKLWKKVPDPRYVSPPGRGSVHSRGGAVDITIVDSLEQELDMGTPYDYFGKKAYWAYLDQQPKIVQKNRTLLLNTLKKYGFKTVSTEWWHYSYRRAWFPLSDMRWSCPDSLSRN